MGKRGRKRWDFGKEIFVEKKRRLESSFGEDENGEEEEGDE